MWFASRQTGGGLCGDEREAMFGLRSSLRALRPALRCREYMTEGGKIRAGQAIKHDGGLYRVRKAQSVKPGKGGTYNQLELTDMRTGTKTSARFRSSESVEQAQFDPPEKYQLLYNDGEKLALMHNTTFEQVELEVSLVPTDALPFLEDGMDIVLLTIEGEPFDVELPSTASCIVAETPPNMKGATQTAQFKPATLENGVVVKVPAFVETGDTILVKVQGGIDYLERV